MSYHREENRLEYHKGESQLWAFDRCSTLVGCSVVQQINFLPCVLYVAHSFSHTFTGAHVVMHAPGERVSKRYKFLLDFL